MQPGRGRADRLHRKRDVIRRNPLPDRLQVTVTPPAIVVQSQTGHFGRQKLDKRIGGGNRCELISLQFKRLQRSQASKSISFQVDQRIGAQVKDHQATEAEKGRRADFSKSISGQGEAPKWGRLEEGLWGDGRQRVVAQVKLDEVGQFDEGLRADVTCDLEIKNQKNFMIKLMINKVCKKEWFVLWGDRL